MSGVLLKYLTPEWFGRHLFDVSFGKNGATNRFGTLFAGDRLYFLVWGPPRNNVHNELASADATGAFNLMMLHLLLRSYSDLTKCIVAYMTTFYQWVAYFFHSCIVSGIVYVPIGTTGSPTSALRCADFTFVSFACIRILVSHHEIHFRYKTEYDPDL